MAGQDHREKKKSTPEENMGQFNSRHFKRRNMLNGMRQVRK